MGVGNLLTVEGGRLQLGSSLPRRTVEVLESPVLLTRTRDAADAREADVGACLEVLHRYAEEPVVARPCTRDVGLARTADEALAVGVGVALAVDVGVRVGEVSDARDGAQVVLLDELFGRRGVVGARSSVEEPLHGAVQTRHRSARPGAGLLRNRDVEGGAHAQHLGRADGYHAVAHVARVVGRRDGERVLLVGLTRSGRYAVPGVGLRGGRPVPVGLDGYRERLGALCGEGRQRVVRRVEVLARHLNLRANRLQDVDAVGRRLVLAHALEGDGAAALELGRLLGIGRNLELEGAVARLGELRPVVLLHRIEEVDVGVHVDVVALCGASGDNLRRGRVVDRDGDVRNVGCLYHRQCSLGLAAVGVAEYDRRRARQRVVVVRYAEAYLAVTRPVVGPDEEPVGILGVGLDRPVAVRADVVADELERRVADHGLHVEAQFGRRGDHLARHHHVFESEIGCSRRRVVVVARRREQRCQQERCNARPPAYLAE